MCKGEKEGREAKTKQWDKYWILYLEFGILTNVKYSQGNLAVWPRSRMESVGINIGCEEKVKNMQREERGKRDWEKYWILHLSFGVWYLYRSGKSGGLGWGAVG